VRRTTLILLGALTVGCNSIYRIEPADRPAVREVNARVFLTQTDADTCWMHVAFSNGHSLDQKVLNLVCIQQAGEKR
jgi:hypothetical protein